MKGEVAQVKEKKPKKPVAKSVMESLSETAEIFEVINDSETASEVAYRLYGSFFLFTALKRGEENVIEVGKIDHMQGQLLNLFN